MAVTGSRVIKFTADNDTYDSGQKRLKVQGVRLVAGSAADATAQVRLDDSNGAVIYSLAAVQKTADESQLSYMLDSGKMHVDLSGTDAELFVYLE